MTIILLVTLISWATILMLVARPLYQPIPVPVHRFCGNVSKKGNLTW